MAKKKTSSRTTKQDEPSTAGGSAEKVKSPPSENLRESAEDQYGLQLRALAENDQGPRPASWRLSPRAVVDYIVGEKTISATIDGKKTQVEITKKFFGDVRIVERAVGDLGFGASVVVGR